MNAARFLIVFFTVCSLMAFSGAVSAEITEGAFSLNPHVGGYDFDKDQGLANDLLYGLGFGYNYTKNFGVEAVFDYIDTEDSAGGDAKGYIYRIDALYHLMPDSKLVPYISAGIGGLTLDSDTAGSDTFTLFTPGVGIKYFLTKTLALRGEGRYLVSFNDLGFNDAKRDFAYSFGLSYLFGGRAEKPAPPPPPPPPPPPAPKDNDGDGVIDNLDKCPGTPRGVFVDANGCPKDSDGDGVPDYLDKCPDTPRGVAVDAQGCPPPVKKEVKKIELEDIHFDYDKVTLTDRAKTILKKNIETLSENPEIMVLVEGHACAHGAEGYNLRLSDRRANAVKEYLTVEGKIADSRVSTITYGETRLAMPEIPTPKNKNSEEAKANRRVHFEVVVH
jgi:OOP family OmpA-OmpF porin